MGPLVLDIEGTALTKDDVRRIADPLVGMVILFTRNYRDRDQLTELCSAIHAVKPGLLIAVDHEGGRVQRFQEGLPKFLPWRNWAKSGLMNRKTRCCQRWPAVM